MTYPKGYKPPEGNNLPNPGKGSLPKGYKPPKGYYKQPRKGYTAKSKASGDTIAKLIAFIIIVIVLIVIIVTGIQDAINSYNYRPFAKGQLVEGDSDTHSLEFMPSIHLINLVGKTHGQVSDSLNDSLPVKPFHIQSTILK